MNTTITKQVDKARYSGLINMAIKELGFNVIADNNPYVVSRLSRESCTMTFYTSGKVLLQGEDGMINAVNAGLFNAGVDSSENFESHIGADEVGKGDYFGPLVVCACFVPKEYMKRLKEEGVGDSKTKSDTNIVKIYEKVKDLVKYRISVLSPEDYNNQYPQFNNVAKLLSKLHMSNIHSFVEELKRLGIEYNKVVIDQFSSNKDRIGSLSNGLKIDQMHHAESQDITVACASIIARRYFLGMMEEMNNKYGFEFPKGATHVLPKAKEFVQNYGRDELKRVAKISFKTTLQIL